MKRALNVFLLAAVVGVAACGSDSGPVCNLQGGEPLASSPWPKFRADIANTGRSATDLSAFSGPLVEFWKRETGGAVASSPAIGVQGEAYVGSADSRVYRVNADGTDEWQALTGNAVVSGPALDATKNVFVTSNDGNLYTFDTTNGLPLRNPVILLGVLTSPTVAPAPNQGVLYAGSLTSGAFAVCPNTVGRWASQLVPVAGVPAIGGDGTVYIAGANNTRNVLSVNPDNGVPNWIFTATAAINAAPVLDADDNVYVVDSRGRVFVIDPDTGTSPGVLFDTDSQVLASPALGTDGTLYIADVEGTLFALDTSTGSERWRFQIPGGAAINSSPALSADRTLIFGADDGVVYAVSDLGGSAEIRWTFHTGGPVRSSPAIANDGLGTIYVGSNDRHLYALRPSP